MSGVQPTHIAQISITVGELERAKRFYRDSLGLTHLFDAPPGLSFFQCGETRLMLSRPEGSDTSGNSILYYAVDDAEAAYGKLLAKGVRFEEQPKRIATVGGKDIWLAIARDSEDNLIGLMSERDAS
jgi:methylmalonyl-CoA/ethylmalonyl-CoA epimerase